MNMKKISKSSSIISSPAASFDRIEITYDKFDELETILEAVGKTL